MITYYTKPKTLKRTTNEGYRCHFQIVRCFDDKDIEYVIISKYFFSKENIKDAAVLRTIGDVKLYEQIMAFKAETLDAIIDALNGMTYFYITKEFKEFKESKK